MWKIVVVVSALAAGCRSLAPPPKEPMLRQLSLQASVAARAGRCVAVETIADRVAELDRRYRRIGFVADPLVALCLD
jgi:hypothetical protein